MKKMYVFALALLMAVGAQAADLVHDLSTVAPGNVEIGVQLAGNTITLTGTLPATSKLILGNNAEVTLEDVTIAGNTENLYTWAGITCAGNATIHLKGTNVVKGCGNDYAGIYVPFGSTLTIDGEGSLDVSAPGYGAAIGANKLTGAGNIIINGGVINAIGGLGAAAIGGVTDYGCGYIHINGGTIYAKSYYGGAAIGGGFQGSNGNIIIANTVYRLTAELDTYSVQMGSSVIGLGGGDGASSYTVTVGGVDYGTIGVTTNPFVYNPGEQAEQEYITSSKAQLMDMINDANLIVNFIEADEALDTEKAESWLSRLNGAINRSLAVYNNANAALLEVGNAMNDISGEIYEVLLAVFEEERNLFIASLEALLEEGDSEACRQIVADKVAFINESCVYNPNLYVSQNLSVIEYDLSYDAFMAVKEALRAQREAEKQGIDQIANDQLQMTNKVLRDGKLFIEKNNKTYDALGSEIK